MKWCALLVCLAMLGIAPCIAASATTRAVPPAPAPLPAPGTTIQDCPECPEMIVIPGGSYTMGSPATENFSSPDERPQRQVTIHSFALGKYDVTFDEWEACVDANGCLGYRPPDQGWGRGNHPVISVSWDDAQSYVQWLSAATGEQYRLPTEAEWEYAARAGTTTAFYWGEDIGTGNANCDNCGTPFQRQSSPVGSFAANPFGLYDMAGNVWQWVEDCYHDSHAGAPTDGSSRTGGLCKFRVLRGGSWGFLSTNLRSAARARLSAGHRFNDDGFRVVRMLD